MPMKRLLTAVLAALILALPTGAVPLPDEAGPKDKFVVIETSMGSIKIELFPDKAPKTVENFLAYVDARFYEGTLFHRVIPNFMIQGGGLTANLDVKATTRAPVVNESKNGLSNVRGTISVARMVDPDSGTSQFFINVIDNKNLDRANFNDGAGYCVFGQVVDGMDVVDKIRDVATGNRGVHSNVPVQDVVIKAVRRSRK
jgi:cyclophilin family peptidyl-prolyl cis-trans isomerase